MRPSSPQADYGIAGDLYAVVPALIQALQEASVDDLHCTRETIMSEDKLDVIIVGAGVAGSTAAYLLASRAGGGPDRARAVPGQQEPERRRAVRAQSCEQLIPNYWEEAPVERCITNQVITFMTGEASFNIDFKTQAFSQPPTMPSPCCAQSSTAGWPKG